MLFFLGRGGGNWDNGNGLARISNGIKFNTHL